MKSCYPLFVPLAGLIVLGLSRVPVRAADGPYHLVKKIPLRGEGVCNELTVDERAHRLYVARGNRIDVLDLRRERPIGAITDTPDVRGFTVVPQYHLGFAISGKSEAVSLIQLATLRTFAKMKAGHDPAAIVFEPSRAELYAFNRRAQSVTVGEADDGDFVATIDLGGDPASATTDPNTPAESKAARVYCSLEDKDQVLSIAAPTHKVKGRWPVAPGRGPRSLALDATNHRLFVACTNRILIMMDSSGGEVLATIPIGTGAGAVTFDAGNRNVFCCCEDGSLVIAHEDDPKKLTLLQKLKIQPGTRTMALDPGTHRVYLGTAKFRPQPDGTDAKSYAKPLPGTFKLQVFGL